MSKKEKIEVELIKRELSRRNLRYFTEYTMPVFKASRFHKSFYKVLQYFADSVMGCGPGKLKKLIISVPPQHGKSEGTTRRLPSYLIGKNPDLKISVSSYNQTFVRKFSRDIRRILKDPLYTNIFNTRYPQPTDVNYTRTVDEFEIPNHSGSMKFVGRGGALTGSPVDVAIMDDLYKDYAEGNSPIIREAVIDWYTSVVKTRLHNDSSQLIVFTRWHEDDLIGYLEKNEKVVNLTCEDDIRKARPDVWYKLNYPAIQTETGKNSLDNRVPGTSLWAEKHSLAKLKEYQSGDKEKFDSLYQGDPRPAAGLLYSRFMLYDKLPEYYHFKGVYIDTADTGSDFLCAIYYRFGKDGYIYIEDVIYSDQPMEKTEPVVAEKIKLLQTDKGDFESNNGGRGFYRSVKRILKEKHRYFSIKMDAFHQAGNKESRIISASSNIQSFMLFPKDWSIRFAGYYDALTRFKRNFKSNAHDDAPDATTGVWEVCEKWADVSGSSLYDW